MSFRFNTRDELTAIAKHHTNEMWTKYRNEIDTCIHDTHIYGGPVSRDLHEHVDTKGCSFQVKASDSVSAIFYEDTSSNKVAVLNFASYKQPGGGFIRGMMAQEEALCHSSFLYNVLQDFDTSFYTYNRKNLNRGLYTHRALYTPNVTFTNNEINCMSDSVDVITCAAPNKSVCLKYGKFTEQENSSALRLRIIFIRDICETEHVDVLIAGAYGCGVFRQDPTEVATIFREVFEVSALCKVVFPIPAGKNLLEFKSVFE